MHTPWRPGQEGGLSIGQLYLEKVWSCVYITYLKDCECQIVYFALNILFSLEVSKPKHVLLRKRELIRALPKDSPLTCESLAKFSRCVHAYRSYWFLFIGVNTVCIERDCRDEKKDWKRSYPNGFEVSSDCIYRYKIIYTIRWSLQSSCSNVCTLVLFQAVLFGNVICL